MFRKISIGFAALLAGALTLGTSAQASPQQYPVTGTVTKVLVNRTGGITVTGTVDCTQAVRGFDWAGFHQWLLDQGFQVGSWTFDEHGVPAKLSVVAGIGWTAYQPVGRRTMLQAGYQQQSFQWSCFNNNPVAAESGPLCGGDNGPCPWSTTQDPLTRAPTWVYASNGKFTAGPIHVDLTAAGVVGEVGYTLLFVDGTFFSGGQYPLVPMDMVAPPAGFDLRAVKVR